MPRPAASVSEDDGVVAVTDDAVLGVPQHGEDRVIRHGNHTIVF